MPVQRPVPGAREDSTPFTLRFSLAKKVRAPYTYMTMPYEELSAQYPTFKGISVELPFVKFKYVKVDSVQADTSRNTRKIDVSVPAEGGSFSVLPRMIVPRETQVTTLGIDSMVSYASVIHELTYGRIDASPGYHGPSTYPEITEPSTHSLDIVV